MRPPRRRRGPDELVHVWFEEGVFGFDQTECEYAEGRRMWLEREMEPTTDAPTCLRCIAKAP